MAHAARAEAGNRTSPHSPPETGGRNSETAGGLGDLVPFQFFWGFWFHVSTKKTRPRRTNSKAKPTQELREFRRIASPGLGTLERVLKPSGFGSLTLSDQISRELTTTQKRTQSHPAFE